MSNVENNFISKAVNRYSDMILRIAFQYTQNKADAEDIMQDVFLALIKQPFFNEEEHLKAWIIRVAINKSKDYLKAAKIRNAAALDIPYGFEKEDTEIMDQVQRLPSIDRSIIYLHYFEGYTAKEIACIIKKKENTIHVRLKRARVKLKSLLEED